MRSFQILIFTLLFFASCTGKKTFKISDKFMDSLSFDTFSFFWELSDSVSGNIPDRWPSKSFSSIAATGFGLTSYLVGVERGYISRTQASERVLKTLRFLSLLKQDSVAQNVGGYKGFFYHFLDMRTGARYQLVELSTIDTGLLMMGILSCQTYFDQDNPIEKEIYALSDSLYRKVDWNWAMNNDSTMSMGWSPENKFITARWKGYNEAMLLYVLALGSPTHSVSPTAWTWWTKTYRWGKFQGQEHINFGPLFGHQYSHVWIDFKGIKDDYMTKKGIDYFENSRRATLANRQYCIQNPSEFIGYSDKCWGLTACDGPGNSGKADFNCDFREYSARGAARWQVVDDGTIAPTAVGGSIPFAPEYCIPTLQHFKYSLGDKIYGKYGFKDAFNLTITYENGESGWFDTDYLGIDQGPILLQLENLRSGFVWKLMKKNKYIQEGLSKAGFKKDI